MVFKLYIQQIFAMKKHFLKLLTLALFVTVGLQSCSVEYRENRRKREEQHRHDHDHDNDHHDYQTH